MSQAASDSVLLTREGAVATLTLNRPERLNALDLAMWHRLGEVLREIEADPSLRALRVQGAGQAFAAGADLAEFARTRATAGDAEAYGRVMVAALHGLRDLKLPTVAMIRGACVGAGLEIAIMCDLRIAAEGSRFGVPIQKVGVVMPWPELGDLIETVGRATALEILLEGRLFEAGEAAAKGLVTRVVPAEKLETEVAETLRRLTDGAPSSHRLHKRMARRLMDAKPLSPEEWREAYEAVESADYREGLAAFAEKRKPRFSGG
ncbi:enoyl-CoA hydratase/isomerase family protein [Hypericibacter sp.]|uniref:enoyl-CoA hydratase/isomerase family protein n=1 Tax=Hypericibacter sp. TaxID=2705401 RepID=UPI003D6D6FA1